MGYASSPGKIIVFGEYAVLLGFSAYVLPLPQMLSIEMSYKPLTSSYCKFYGDAESLGNYYSLAALENQANYVQQQYDKINLSFAEKIQQFKTNSCLLHFLSGCLLPKYPGEWKIRVSSQLIAGSGQGSSAALVVSFLRAFYEVIGKELTTTDFLTKAKYFESYQHGQSSGIDVAVAYYNKPLRFRSINDLQILPISNLPKFVIVNTGQPTSTTGDGVAQVMANKLLLQKSYKKVDECVYLAVTDHPLKYNNLNWQNSLKAAHKWLVECGVVPTKVQNFIKEIELRGGAAKISGAGSISGTNGGMVLVSCDEQWQDLVRDYGYRISDPIP